MKRTLALFLLLLSALAQPVVRELKATVVGDGVGWETHTLEIWLAIPEKGRARLDLFSPGFDPTDYRSALLGKPELGDERYDGGKGELKATFRLYKDGKLLREMAFGVEPHRWAGFFEGEVEAGVYLFQSEFLGNGKNAFVLRVEAPNFGFFLDPRPQLILDVSTQTTTLRLLPDERGWVWVEPFSVYSEGPLEVAFYDEDGPEELRARVRYGDGSVEERPVSGDREWIAYTKRPGLAIFGFTQPPTARQYSNTVAFRVGACTSLENGVLKAVPSGEARARVVDEEGRPLSVPVEAKDRVFRPLLPEGASLLRVEARGAVFAEGDRVRVGCPGGEVAFVVRLPKPPEPERPPQGEVRFRVVVALPGGDLPAKATLRLGDLEAPVDGEKTLALPQGRYPLAVLAEGARVEAPKEVEVLPGKRQEVLVRLLPEVALSLAPEEVYLRVGEEGEVVLTATTPYPGLLPAELSLALPEGLAPLGAPRAQGPLTKDRPFPLKVRFLAEKEGTYALQGLLAPWGLRAEGRVVVVRPATFRLTKEALTPEVEAGGVARFRVTVVNEGDEEGRALLLDRFLGGEERREVFLKAKEGRSYEFAFPVPLEAQGTLVNRAELSTGEKAEAEVRVLRPKAHLERSLPHRIYLPGEEVALALRVENRGEAPMRYVLEDACPDWLSPLGPTRFEGYLKPGEGALHTYRARVLLGPEAEGTCAATLRTPTETLRAEVALERRLLLLGKEADPPRLLEGSQGVFRPGYQVLLRDGVGTVMLRPLLTPQEVRLRARFNELERSFRLFAGGSQEALWLAQGSVGVAYDPEEGRPRFFGLARGYVETPLEGGFLQGALDTTGGLSKAPEAGFFPVTGSGEEARRPLASDDPVALRYTTPEYTLAYERGPLAPGLGEATALRLATRGDARVEAFLALLPKGQVREEIVPDGTAFYRLSGSPAPGSLRLFLVEGGRTRALEAGVDYTYDFLSGEIVLARPLAPFTPGFAPVRLVAEYAPLSAPREELALGAQAAYQSGPWRFGLGGYLRLDLQGFASQGYALGASLAYGEGGSGVGLEATFAGKWRFGLSAALREGPLEARGNLAYEEGGEVQGAFRAAYDLGFGAVALEHTTPARTGLVYEAKLAQGLRFGLGAGYAWREGSLYLLGRAAYQEGRARFGLSHASLLSGGQETRLDLLWPLGEALEAEGSLAYLWGEGLQGAFGLRQRLGSANLALSYQLPTASGEGNRARFGLEAPLPLTENLSANLGLYALYAFSGGQGELGGSLGLRYAREGLVATFGVEGALGPKLTLRGGAAGSLDPENTLGLDFALSLLPEVKGRFSLAYALRSPVLSLLTYHRYATETGLLEGQLSAAYAPSLAFSVRPAFGYRYPFPDPEGATYALGLYATLFPTELLGLGGGAAYTFQPATGAGSLSFSVEGTLRFSPLWLSLGYQFGPSLFAPEGVYLRLDVFGGSR
ncbi:hypothetical conserved protein [Thermus thermophilus]|nr:hypothetical conserved protein [Thermus thermophilus]